MTARTEFLPIAIGILILLLWGGAIVWLTLRRDQRRWDLLCAALLAGMVTAFFWPTISGAVYQPANGGDLVSFLFPIYRFAARTLSLGRLPLWNPHLYGGAPFVGDIQAGFLYPPNLLLFLLNPTFDYRWMQLLSIGHLWWAGLGVYVLARTLGCSRPAALLAGLAFGFSDILFIHLGNLNLIAVLSWSGWILAACHRALTRSSLVWAGVAALLFAIANYAGHAQSSYYLGMAVGIYSLGLLAVKYWELFTAKAHRTALRQSLAGLQYPVMLFVLTALLSAPILFPAFEMLPYTHRAEFGYQDTVSYSLAPAPAFIGLLTPGFYGRGPWAYWGSWDRVELPYAGLVTLLLAAAAFLLPIPEKPRRLLPWLALALFGFAVALGGNTPVHGWLDAHPARLWQLPGPRQNHRPVGAGSVRAGGDRVGCPPGRSEERSGTSPPFPFRTVFLRDSPWRPHLPPRPHPYDICRDAPAGRGPRSAAAGIHGGPGTALGSCRLAGYLAAIGPVSARTSGERYCGRAAARLVAPGTIRRRRKHRRQQERPDTWIRAPAGRRLSAGAGRRST